MNVQVYNRCIGTRFCANGCPYHVRFFNYWEPQWPESLKNQLNPDVTVRGRGIMEKCSFCIQRIKRSTRESERDSVHLEDGDRALNPGCVNACASNALTFGDFNDESSKVSKMKSDAMSEEGRGYRLMDNLGTDNNVIYLKKVDESAGAVHGH